MNEHEVFDMLSRIDEKLDDIRKNCQNRLLHCKDCMGEDRQIIQDDLDSKVDWGIFKWISGGVATALLVLFGYTMVVKENVAVLQTEVNYIKKAGNKDAILEEK